MFKDSFNPSITLKVSHNIARNAMFDDYSFANTLAILLADRTSDDIGIGFTYYYDNSDIYFSDNTLKIYICNCRGDDAKEKAFEALKKIPEDNSEIELIKKVGLFFNNEAVCLVNKSNKSTAVCVKNLDVEKYHYLMCGIPAFLPWYFKDNPPTEKEMELLASIRENKPNNYVRIMNELSILKGSKSKYIHESLDGFETVGLKNSRSNLVSTKLRLESDVAELQRRMGEKLRQIRDYNININSIDRSLAEDSNDEMASFFCKNENLILEDVSGETLIFDAIAFLEYFDEDMATTYLDNERSYFYKDGGRDYTTRLATSEIKLLLNEIFITRNLKIKFAAKYAISCSSHVRGIREMQFDHPELENCMANTHINRYECLGDYNQVFSQLMQTGDNLMAVQQCIESCKSLNLGDSIVMGEFMKELLGSKCRKCILLPDGNYVDAVGAVKYIKENMIDGEED